MTALTRRDERPAYGRLYDELRDKLISGAIAQGACLTGEHRLSRDYGISRPTVRKALEKLTAEGLIHKRQGKGTFAGPAAVHTGTVGVVHYPTDVGFAARDFYSNVFRGLQNELNRRGSMMLLAGGSAYDPRRVETADLRGKADGLIIFGIMDEAYIRTLTAAGLPAVLFDYAGDDLGLDSGVVDDAGGARTATEYLVGLGHRHIGYLGGVRTVPWQGIVPEASSEIREQACRRVLAEAGLPAPGVAKGIVCVLEEGYKAMQALLARTPRPTAVIVFDNTMALGAVKALNERGLRVPEDISMVAFEGDEAMVPFFDPRLAVMRTDSADRMGRELARLFFERAADRTKPVEKIVIPYRLEPGGSCVRPPADL